MSSISAYNSPLQLLQSQLQSSVSNGSIKPADQDALSSALTDIDSSLSSDSSDKSSAPTDLKSKVDDLISQEVSSGKLTSDQATELKSVFAKAFGKGGADGASAAGKHHGGPHVAGGSHGAGGPPPSASTDPDSDSSGSKTPTSASDLLKQFLQSLQDSLQTGSSSTYSASGSSSTSSTASVSAILLDYKT